MKNKFQWSIDPKEEEIKKIWDEGILTVDANVLLDLYRYHKDTCKALVDALEQFTDRIWLTHQAADEFFRNRKKVIVSASNSFQAAEKVISSIQDDSREPIKSLKSNRIILDHIADNLSIKLTEVLEKTLESISEAKDAHPNYLNDDPILTRLLELFDNSVGDEFSKDDLENNVKEAKLRAEKRIPPGYLDSDKDGDKPYGDYLMWLQMLNHAKDLSKSMIFVTSENKEDWWDRSSGKTTGIQYELLKEAHQVTGQRFLFYRTDRFLEFAAKQSGNEANESAVAEIRKIVKERSDNVHIVRLTGQSEAVLKHNKRIGYLEAEILRPTFNFTCSGRLEPEMDEVPEIRGVLLAHPESLPEYKITASTGTTFDFNIHIRSQTYGVQLPAGKYRIEYQAYVQPSTQEDTLSEEI